MAHAEAEVQVGIRMPLWLKQDLDEAAEKSGWTFSQQVRHELSALRGKEHKPFLPQPPSHDGPSRKR